MQKQMNIVLTPSLILFLILGSIGLIFMIIGISFLIFDSQKKNRCISITYGQVMGYSFMQDAPEPIVEYEVAGEKYKKSRRFRGVITTTKGISLKSINPNDYSIYVDERDIVHIKKGIIINMRKAAEELYPLGSTLAVFYNPQKPKQAFVERIPQGTSILGIVFTLTGLAIALIGIIIGLLIR